MATPPYLRRRSLTPILIRLAYVYAQRGVGTYKLDTEIQGINTLRVLAIRPWQLDARTSVYRAVKRVELLRDADVLHWVDLSTQLTGLSTSMTLSLEDPPAPDVPCHPDYEILNDDIPEEE